MSSLMPAKNRCWSPRGGCPSSCCWVVNFMGADPVSSVWQWDVGEVKLVWGVDMRLSLTVRQWRNGRGHILLNKNKSTAKTYLGYGGETKMKSEKGSESLLSCNQPKQAQFILKQLKRRLLHTIKNILSRSYGLLHKITMPGVGISLWVFGKGGFRL